MSRPPPQQQKTNRLTQQNERPLNASKSPYMNPNYLPSPHHLNQPQNKSNSRDNRHQQNEFNSNSNGGPGNSQQLSSMMHHMDSIPSTNNGMNKKPSLLSGYHNPSFSPNDRLVIYLTERILRLLFLNKLL